MILIFGGLVCESALSVTVSAECPLEPFNRKAAAEAEGSIKLCGMSETRRVLIFVLPSDAKQWGLIFHRIMSCCPRLPDARCECSAIFDWRYTRFPRCCLIIL